MDRDGWTALGRFFFDRWLAIVTHAEDRAGTRIPCAPAQTRHASSRRVLIVLEQGNLAPEPAVQALALWAFWRLVRWWSLVKRFRAGAIKEGGRLGAWQAHWRAGRRFRGCCFRRFVLAFRLLPAQTALKAFKTPLNAAFHWGWGRAARSGTGHGAAGSQATLQGRGKARGGGLRRGGSAFAQSLQADALFRGIRHRRGAFVPRRIQSARGPGGSRTRWGAGFGSVRLCSFRERRRLIIRRSCLARAL